MRLRDGEDGGEISKRNESNVCGVCVEGGVEIWVGSGCGSGVSLKKGGKGKNYVPRARRCIHFEFDQNEMKVSTEHDFL